MTELPKELDLVYWAEKERQHLAALAELTGLPAGEIEASLHEPDAHSRKTATFTPMPYGEILVRVVDRGYPRQRLIQYTDLVRIVTTAVQRGYTIIDNMAGDAQEPNEEIAA